MPVTSPTIVSSPPTSLFVQRDRRLVLHGEERQGHRPLEVPRCTWILWAVYSDLQLPLTLLLTSWKPSWRSCLTEWRLFTLAFVDHQRWLSSEAIEAKRLCRHLERRWLTTKDEVDRIAYRRTCRSTDKIINESRSTYYNAKLQECSDEPAKRWSVVKELLHSADLDNTRTDCECRELCNTFYSFFVSKIASLKLANNDKISQLSSTQCFLDPPHCGIFLDSLLLVTPDEVLKILQSCSNKSSPMDYIPTSLLLACKPIFSHLICRLANLSFTQGCFPSSFKLASITPLLKKKILINLNLLTTAQYPIWTQSLKLLSAFF